MAIQEKTRKDARFIVISQCPDVCKSPTAPVPYTIVGKFDTAIMVSPNVRSNGFPVFHMGSRLPTVTGDEAGVGGGVASQVNRGFCKPVVPVSNIRCNAQMTNHSHDTIMLMNGAGPDGPFNTFGRVIYTGPMYFAAVGPGGTVPAGANGIVAGENPAEMGCLGKLGDLSGGGGIDDLVGMAQQAYGLATTDWSNPSAVLGAIGGVAGIAGMGGFAKAAQFAQQGYALATTDWSNPGAALGTLMGAAGPLLGGTVGQAIGGAVGSVAGGLFEAHDPAQPIATQAGWGMNPASRALAGPAGAAADGLAGMATTGGFAGGNPAAEIAARSIPSAPTASNAKLPPGLIVCRGFGF